MSNVDHATRATATPATPEDSPPEEILCIPASALLIKSDPEEEAEALAEAKALMADHNAISSFAMIHSITARRLSRLLTAPPVVLVEVFSDLLQGRQLGRADDPGSNNVNADGSPRDLTAHLACMRAHLTEESDRFKKLMGKLGSLRNACGDADRAIEAKAAELSAKQTTSASFRAQERVAKEEAQAARSAAESATRGCHEQIHSMERDLTKCRDRTVRLQAKLASDRVRAEELEAQAAAAASRADEAERRLASAVAREAAAGETLRACYVADREREAVEKRRVVAEKALACEQERAENAEVLLEVAKADAETKLEAALQGVSDTNAMVEIAETKNAELERRLEGLRYRMMDVMKDIAIARDRVVYAESALVGAL